MLLLSFGQKIAAEAERPLTVIARNEALKDDACGAIFKSFNLESSNLPICNLSILNLQSVIATQSRFCPSFDHKTCSPLTSFYK